MNLKLTSMMLLCAGCSSLYPAQAASLIVNGNFQTGNLDGWTVSGWYKTEFNGNSWASSNFLVGPTALSQTLNLMPGVTYDLSWKVRGGVFYSQANYKISIGDSTQLFSNVGPEDYGDFFRQSTTFTPVKPSTTISFSTDWGGMIVGLDDVAVTRHGPPSRDELAVLSKASYGDSVDSRFDKIMPTASENGFSADAYKCGDQIVIAFRGTAPDRVSVFKDAYADTSFATGIPSEAMRNYVSRAVEFVKDVQSQNGGAHITLTGHSLGGGIAELLGQASGYDTVTFNAPGAAKLADTLHDTLAGLSGLSGNSSASIQNYRLWGDVISLVGDQIGSVTTIHPAGASTDDTRVADTLRAFTNHGIDSVISALAGDYALDPDVTGPTPTQADIRLISGDLATAYDHLFDVRVKEAILYFFDPPAAGGYILSENASSPFLTSIELPPLAGVSSYELQANGAYGTSWLTGLTSLNWYDLPAGTSGFSLFALDGEGRVSNFPDALIFGLTFGSSGELKADVHALPMMGEVPEPVSWSMSIIGFGLTGIRLRSQKPTCLTKGVKLSKWQ